jgi:hypothetical protein
MLADFGRPQGSTSESWLPCSHRISPQQSSTLAAVMTYLEFEGQCIVQRQSAVPEPGTLNVSRIRMTASPILPPLDSLDQCPTQIIGPARNTTPDDHADNIKDPGSVTHVSTCLRRCRIHSAVAESKYSELDQVSLAFTPEKPRFWGVFRGVDSRARLLGVERGAPGVEGEKARLAWTLHLVWLCSCRIDAMVL